MAIVSRTNDQSQQRHVIPIAERLTVSGGETGVIGHIPFPCALEAIQLASFSVAGSLNLLLQVQRFIPGSGVTVFNIGSTFVPPSFGTSGVIPSGVSLPASGSSLLQLMANDVLSYLSGGGGTAMIQGLAGSIVVRPVQDIRVYLNGLV